ncbi:metallophosphoesterase [Sphingobium yanoikuyae]|uniref:metallophosphoesterase n=1 Tax=Sphingobium yanoikuyae TaxID=13690 RepID=UPI0031DEB1D0
MIKALVRKLISLLRGKVEQSPRIPEGMRVYAVGDVHGRQDLLEDLLCRLVEDNARRPPAQVLYIFLGDLIDRGPASAGVVNLVLDFATRHDCRFIRGNHEEVLLQLLDEEAGDGSTESARMFARIGGRQTALSYGVPEPLYNGWNFDVVGEMMRPFIAQAHIDFFLAMEEMIVLGDYIFVHAGIDPTLPIDAQDLRKTRWIRTAFTNAAGPFEKYVVHGHSITSGVDMHPHRCGIDTGAYRSGILSALGCEGAARWTIQASTPEC